MRHHQVPRDTGGGEVTRHEIASQFCTWLNDKAGHPNANTNPEACSVECAVEFMDDYLFRSSTVTAPLGDEHLGAPANNPDPTTTDQLAREIYLRIIANQKVEVNDAHNTVELSYTLAEEFLRRGRE